MSKAVEKKNDAAEETSVSGFKQNDRYRRAFLRPVVKSVYQPRNVSRLNGSLNNSIVSTGFTPYDNNKGLHNGGM